jgi:glutamate-ammonia-ligase adenylyltransferase
MVRPADLSVGAPDEGDAHRRAERLFDAASQTGLDLTDLDDVGARVATLACQRAPYLATLLTRDPDRLFRVAQDPYLRREKPLDQLIGQVRAAVSGVVSAGDLRTALRRIRADELVRLGVRELELGLDTEVGRELARLADVCFDAAIEFHDRELRAKYGPPIYRDDDGVEREAKLAVIGMGKLGGEELNFASDVDVIYVYSSDQGEAGALSLHEYFAKLCTLVTSALSEVTEDDVVFRVDLRLRPEGAKGAIANSLAQMERYYETFGRPWERQAWIKARACAGDPELGRETLEMLKPFVFPRYTSPAIIDEVHALNRRIKRELVKTPSVDVGFDLKNGVGGIREIEFFTQALQLIHGGKRLVLRCRGTLAALDALLFAGLVSDDEHLSLWRAYRWLRHAEHVLQLEAGLQTQTIPADPELQNIFARRLGYVDRDALQRILVAHTGSVARMFKTLGVEAELDRPDIDAILRGELSDDAEAAALARLGFRDVTAATAELARAQCLIRIGARSGSSAPAKSASPTRSTHRQCAALRDRCERRSGSSTARARRSDRASWRSVVDLALVRRATGHRAPARLVVRCERISGPRARRYTRADRYPRPARPIGADAHGRAGDRGSVRQARGGRRQRSGSGVERGR